MISRTTLATTTAILLLMGGAAFADNNFSNVVQDGAGNAGSVVQGPGDGNKVGTDSMAAGQNGNQNSFGFVQSGDGNEIGTDGTGFEQKSNRNTAAITQSTNGNKVLQVTQTGISSPLGGATLRRNTLSIDQGGGDGNIVSRVSQERVGGLLGAPGQAGNTATITQDGTGNIVGSETIDGEGVDQSGRGNVATLGQSGTDNRIATIAQRDVNQRATVTQEGSGNEVARVDQRGLGNIADLYFNGNDNGVGSFDSDTRINGAWGALSQGEVWQEQGLLGLLLGPNLAGLSVFGDDNLFGVNQSGASNSVSGDVTGNGNQTGVAQFGQDNTADFIVGGSDNQIYIHQGLEVLNIGNNATIQISGDGNHIGAVQSGTVNDALVTVDDGNDNTVNISQLGVIVGNSATVGITHGNSNDVTVTQSIYNTADVGIVGNHNLLDISQSYTSLGAANSISVDIYGSENNRGTFTAGLPAGNTAGSLLPGQLVQNGAGNAITLTVGEALNPNSDGNLFAFSQTGDGNTIQGTVVGSWNEAAIVQAGNANFTSFSQIGNFNSIGVNQ